MPARLRTRQPVAAALVLIAAACSVGSSALAQSRSVGSAPSGFTRPIGNLGTASSSVRGLPSPAGLASPSPFPGGLPSPVQGTLPSPIPGSLPPVVQGNLPSPQPFPGGVPSSVLLPSGAVDRSGGLVTTVPGSGLAPAPGVTTGGVAGGAAAAAAAAAGAAPDTGTMGAAGAAGPASASGAPMRPYNPIEVARSFLEADGNRDSELSRAEAQFLRVMPGTFEQMDRDGNGRVTRFEYQDATGR